MDHIKYSGLVKLSLIASIICATIVSLLKLYGFIHTGSVSLLASLIDSGLDLSVSIMNYVAVRYALEPPDDKHRFGHDKIQDLAVFTQSIFFFGSGIFTIISAINHFVSKHEVEDAHVGIWIMFVAIIITLSLLVFQTYVIKKTNSTIIEADILHYVTDLCTNFAVIIGVYFGKKYPIIDIILGSLIAIYIIHGAYELLKSSIKNLLDEEFDDEEKSQILKIIKEFSEVRGIHDLKTRKTSSRLFIQFHIELDGQMNLYLSHEITEKIVSEISKKFANIEILIHQDPEGIEEYVQYKESI